VLFLCQQSLEKLLKAHVTRETGKLAPRIHNLVRLAEMSDEEFSVEEQALLERLSLYYLQSRYPPEIEALAKTVKRVKAAEHLRQTEALWKRLRRRLTRKG
jgi:HEPN domain-containing protein